MVTVWFGVAGAAEPVVHDGSAEAAVARVAEAARLSPDDLAPTSVEALRSGPSAMVGSGSVAECAGAPVTREQLQLALQGAEGALTYGESDRVVAELGRVAEVERCPPPFDADLLARYWLARGLTDADGARAFSFARALKPDLAWDATWAAERQPMFAAAEPLPPVIVQVPHPGAVIDGRPVEGGRVAVVPGWHTATAPGFLGALEVDADAVLIVPAATPVDLLADAGTEAGRVLPTALMAQAFGEGSRVFVASSEGVWAATAGRTDWLPLQTRKAHPLVPIGLGTTAVGAAATAVTGVLAALAWGATGSAADQVSTASSTAGLLDAEASFDRNAGRYSTLRWLPIPAGAVLVAGLGITGAGLAIGPVTVGGGR